ncbi:MAG: FAD-dependent oxidoreductase [Bacteroidetes bacterium]|nr:MAG: FAD-dependent oxidoreductase [Bacteroidota bacterium]
MAAYDYDLIVLGGGAAGLTAAGIGANLGAKTLMIEKHRLGGDCTWTGCVPSKTLLKAAQVAHQIRCAHRYGLTDHSVAIDVQQVMAHVRRVRQAVYEEADDPALYEAMGVTVQHGLARFIDPHTVEVDGDGGTQRVTGRRFVIATGASAFAPPILGLHDGPFLTSETLFELEAQPERLVIIGAGPIGTEMAQAFARLGTRVTVIDQSERILGHDDPELAGRLQARLEAEGVRYVLGAEVQEVRRHGGLAVVARAGGRVHTLAADALLVATGRRPNLDGLGLDAAGVAYTARGITVNDRCRTSRRHIYAAGDVTGRYQFTHMSEHMAKVAATNALLKLPLRIDADHVPWVTYTDPELAHLGATRRQLDEAGTRYAVYRFPYARLDRAVTDGEPAGLIQVYAKAWNGKILGVDILGARAGELISEYALAMKNGVTLRRIADTIHPYPSYGLGVRRAADQWYARKQSTALIRLVQRVFGYRGPVIEPDPDRIV